MSDTTRGRVYFALRAFFVAALLLAVGAVLERYAPEDVLIAYVLVVCFFALFLPLNPRRYSLLKPATKRTKTAVDQVFGTEELLENILVQLPPDQILIARGVCKQFKACYDGSNTQLRIKTFENVRTIYTPAALASIQNVTSEVNSLLVEPRPNPNGGPWPLRGIPGIKSANVAIFPNGHTDLYVEFDRENWRQEYVGSWTRLYVADAACPVGISVRYSREWVRRARVGDIRVEESGTLAVRVKAGTIGEMIAAAQDLRQIVETYRGELPRYSLDLASRLHIDWAVNRYPPIRCLTTINEATRRLN